MKYAFPPANETQSEKNMRMALDSARLYGGTITRTRLDAWRFWAADKLQALAWWISP